MSVYLVNTVQGLCSLVVMWGAIARVHWLTCECMDSRCGQRIDPSRFLQGAVS